MSGAARVEVLTAPADRGNPYQALLGSALEERGAALSFDNRLRLRRVARADPRHTVIHLHWLEFIVRSTDPGAAAALFSIGRSLHLVFTLAIARLRGIRVVWTVHNLDPHEGGRRWIDRPLARLVARLSSTVLAHSVHCAERISARLGRRHIEVAHHGNYLGAYPPPRRGREETRLALGLPADAHVLLAFGQIRPYKAIPELIAELGRIPDSRFRLLIAGRPIDGEIRLQLEAASATDPRVILRFGRIPEAEVAELHLAADLAVLAYRDVFSSGALMLALSLGLPVVAPAGGTAEEIGSPPAVECYREGCLAEALEHSRTRNETAGRAAAAVAEAYRWDPVALAVLGGRG